MKRPTNELAAISWLRTVPGIPSTKVSTRLPGDNSLIAASGFVTVLAIGGDSNIDVALRSPIIQVRTWAIRGEGQKEPPWWLANQLMEAIEEKCYDHRSFNGVITTKTGYDNVNVPSVYFISEPQKFESDDGLFAIYQAELQFHWIRRPA